MKFRILLSSFCALTLLAGCGKEAEQARLRAEKELEAVRAELDQTKSDRATLNAELVQLRKGNEELLRLRNEVRQLRVEKQQLTQQLQSAQALRTSAQIVEQHLQRLQSENAQLRTATQETQQKEQEALNTCLANLRLLDEAKLRWAADNQKTADAIPSQQDIAPYLKDGVFPACPSGGTYTLNAVGTNSVCSIPGHAAAQ